MSRRSSLNEKLVSLITLAIEISVKRIAVDKYWVAGHAEVHHRTALRYLHTLAEAGLVECFEDHNWSDPSKWEGTPLLSNLVQEMSAVHSTGQPEAKTLLRAMAAGIQPGETLKSLSNEFTRQVVAATMERERSTAAAARCLGLTREGLYRIRKRMGFEIESQEKPIPDDWRERLNPTTPPPKES